MKGSSEFILSVQLLGVSQNSYDIAHRLDTHVEQDLFIDVSEHVDSDPMLREGNCIIVRYTIRDPRGYEEVVPD